MAATRNAVANAPSAKDPIIPSRRRGQASFAMYAAARPHEMTIDAVHRE